MAETKALDMKPFRRQVAPRGQIHLDHLERWVSTQVDAQADPGSLCFAALRRMDYDPIVYLGEQAITALLRKVDLYHLASPTSDKALVKETEEWLWPLLPDLLGVIARSFVYGSSAFVMDWKVEDLHVQVPKRSGGGTRAKTYKDHVHYSRVNELRPDEVDLLVTPENTLRALLYEGRRYDAGRAFVPIWDRQFGEWRGQSARRRAWSWWAKGLIFDLLQARYLERSVHAPLVAYAPGGAVQRDGDDEAPISPVELVSSLVSQLRGGGLLTFPADRDAESNRLFEVEALELPDRSEVFERALNRFDGKKLAAYLVPPAISGLEDGLASGASKVLRDLFATFVEGLVGHAATVLTQVVACAHERNHVTSRVPPPEVKANEIPEKVSKLYLEVLKAVGEGARLGERVDVNSMLDHLGVPVLTSAPSEGGTGGPKRPRGRPRDMTGDRQERREDAETDEGEEDTGGPRE